MKPIIFSYGGGTQSAAICVLVAQGRLPRPKRIVIADTGREASQTWEYLDTVIQPYLANVGLSVEVAPHSLSAVDMYGHNGDLLIPAYTETGMLPGFCSSEWKKNVIKRWLREQGYGPKNPVVTWIGISVDEVGRAKPSGVQWQEYQWPLLFDVVFNRRDCKQVVVDAGLPEPPKSSCWMCPYRSDRQWEQLKEHYPEDYAKAVALERDLHAVDKRGGVYLTKHRRFLADVDWSATSEQQPSLFGEVAHCDSGFCWV